MSKTESSDVVIDDHTYFRLILELVKAGHVDYAKEVVDKLPRKTGFFQEMRNVVPQLIFEGHPDFAFEIFSNAQKEQPFTRTDSYRYTGDIYVRSVELISSFGYYVFGKYSFPI